MCRNKSGSLPGPFLCTGLCWNSSWCVRHALPVGAGCAVRRQAPEGTLLSRASLPVQRKATLRICGPQWVPPRPCRPQGCSCARGQEAPSAACGQGTTGLLGAKRRCLLGRPPRAESSSTTAPNPSFLDFQTLRMSNSWLHEEAHLTFIKF